ncbi:hypothetical protein [Demequina sp. NBRC 110057]|uniref:hypothetical protein n=1 Tax=Demequina sp. NBRC 110057 TaxID=1570346 RepID=UPI001177E3A7|nr:hypothetical protein [Demequina sp. NBRC 110057]
MSGMPVRYEGIVWARLRWGRDGKPVRHLVFGAFFVLFTAIEALFTIAALDTGTGNPWMYGAFTVALAACAWHQFTDAHFARRVAREQAKRPRQS